MNETEYMFLRSYDELGDAVFRHCYLRVSNREEAVDITQEAFTRVWDYMAKGKEIQNMKAFIFRTTNNLIIDWYRKKKPVLLDEEVAEQIPDEVHSPHSERLAEGNEAVRLLEHLDDAHRQVLTLRLVEGWSPKEIADMLEESENTVSVRIHRGIKKLQALFRDGV